MKFYTDLFLVLLSILILWIGSLWIVNNPSVIKSLYPSSSHQTKSASNYVNGIHTHSFLTENKIATLKFKYSSNFNSFKDFVKIPINDFQICKHQTSFPYLSDSKNIFKLAPSNKNEFDNYNCIKNTYNESFTLYNGDYK